MVQGNNILEAAFGEMSGDGCHEDKAGECRITKWERKSGECLGVLIPECPSFREHACISTWAVAVAAVEAEDSQTYTWGPIRKLLFLLCPSDFAFFLSLAHFATVFKCIFTTSEASSMCGCLLVSSPFFFCFCFSFLLVVMPCACMLSFLWLRQWNAVVSSNHLTPFISWIQKRLWYSSTSICLCGIAK